MKKPWSDYSGFHRRSFRRAASDMTEGTLWCVARRQASMGRALSRASGGNSARHAEFHPIFTLLRWPVSPVKPDGRKNRRFFSGPAAPDFPPPTSRIQAIALFPQHATFIPEHSQAAQFRLRCFSPFTSRRDEIRKPRKKATFKNASNLSSREKIHSQSRTFSIEL